VQAVAAPRVPYRPSTQRDPLLRGLRRTSAVLVAGLILSAVVTEVLSRPSERQPRAEGLCGQFDRYGRPLEPYEEAARRGCLDAERGARSGRYVVVAELDTAQMRLDPAMRQLATRYAARLEEQGAEVRFEQPDTGMCCLDCGPAQAPAPEEAYRQSYSLTSRKAFEHQVLRPQQTSIYGIYHETLREVGLGG
jgi:hypothetical protein